ncbi:MAG TPA: hypothetical protein DCE41_33575 [Cytophagales bacterium]|nr:hypothetical protein [Cytophagales bacterium]HAA19386.1 hypothetical protein [Cytophagales bacterium]HAP61908.1 hypothetical protein [Cytophagales bacterium]
MKLLKYLPVLAVLTSCQPKEDVYSKFLTNQIPQDTPLEYTGVEIPDDQKVHKGIFSPDFTAYYYTVSDHAYAKFDVYVVKKQNGSWSEPQLAFFNSAYSEHGMSFSPAGNTLFFSSTRPTGVEAVADTWHLWKTEQVDGTWGEPEWIDIPNLRDKLVSHPTVAQSGALYFHSSNLDYTDMHLYQSLPEKDAYGPAERVDLGLDATVGTLSPYVAPNEEYLLFATIGEQLDLMVVFSDGRGGWTHPKRLNDRINQRGQGNPYVTPDGTFLFFTAEDEQEATWQVKWVNVERELVSNE